MNQLPPPPGFPQFQTMPGYNQHNPYYLPHNAHQQGYGCGYMPNPYQVGCQAQYPTYPQTQSIVPESFPTEVSSPVDTVSSPVDTVSSPVDTVSSPVDTVSSPVDTVSSPVDTVHSDDDSDVDDPTDMSGIKGDGNCLFLEHLANFDW